MKHWPRKTHIMVSWSPICGSDQKDEAEERQKEGRAAKDLRDARFAEQGGGTAILGDDRKLKASSMPWISRTDINH
jgi:hypothetical protein